DGTPSDDGLRHRVPDTVLGFLLHDGEGFHPRDEAGIGAHVRHQRAQIRRRVRQPPLRIDCGEGHYLERASLAARKRRKSSPAWKLERVSGVADTIRKPLDSAIALRAANSSGCQKRSIPACLRVGWRYWPMVRKSTPAERMSSIT